MIARARVLALLLPLVGGCALVFDPIDLGPENHCASDLDCGADRCDTALGMCVARAPESYAYYLEVITPADPVSGTSASAVFGPYDAGAAHDETLELPMPVRVDGTVTHLGAPVSAQLTFFPVDRPLVSDPDRFRTTTIDPASPDFVATMHFALELDPHTDYEVLVEPTGDARAALPPLRLDLSITDAGQHREIEFPEPSQLRTIVGDLFDPSGAPLTGVSIRAIDPVTGVRISSVATVSADATRPGEFQITMSDSVTDYELRVVPDVGRLYPTYVVDPTVLTTITEDGVDRAQVLLPAPMTPVRYSGTVEYPETLADMEPVPNATLTLRSATLVDPETGMVGSIETRIECDESGAFNAQILEGDYEVTVVPSDVPDLGVLVETRTLAEGGTPGIVGHIYRVPARTIFGGIAQAPGGEPIPGARVRAAALGVALEGIPYPEVARRNRSSDTTSGSMGEFRLALDVGVYDLVVEPSDRSGYPWWVETDVGIGGAAVGPSRVYEMRAPTVFAGTLVDAADVPIEEAQVRAFGVLEDGRLVEIGRTTTGVGGELRILLPPEL